MAKRIIFTAIDPNGTVHTRTSDRREYTHTVVYQHDKAALMAYATGSDWTKSDGNNFDYRRECAAGTHPNVTKVTPADKFHSSYTAEKIAEFQQAQREMNAKIIADAKVETDGKTREQYIAERQAERVARVEAEDFTIWHNAGWCGRLDLAQKLAAKSAYAWVRSTILEAKREG